MLPEIDEQSWQDFADMYREAAKSLPLGIEREPLFEKPNGLKAGPDKRPERNQP